MKMTPLEIRQISFQKEMRGYSTMEVDTFMEGLGDDLEELVTENARLKEVLDKQNEQITELKKAEGALTSTLLMAQKAMENMKANAHKEGELTIRQAEMRAEEITGAALQQITELQGEIMNLQRRKSLFVQEVRSLMGSLERDLAWKGDHTQTEVVQEDGSAEDEKGEEALEITDNPAPNIGQGVE